MPEPDKVRCSKKLQEARKPALQGYEVIEGGPTWSRNRTSRPTLSQKGHVLVSIETDAQREETSEAAA